MTPVQESERVYVLECGAYEQAYIAGVYATLDAAKAAGGGEWEEYTAGSRRQWDKKVGDWNDVATIFQFEVQHD